MNNYNFVKTEDGSTGIYDNKAGDIMHSQTGALKEAQEKFINPCMDLLSQEKEVKVLDLCSGIGYNLKALLLNRINSNNKTIVDCVDINSEYIILSLFINDGIINLDLKLFLLYSLFSSSIKVSEILDVINNIDSSCNTFFDADMLFVFKELIKRGYVYNPQLKFNSFVHNIYYNYIPNSYKCELKYTKYRSIYTNYLIGDARKILLKKNTTYDIVFLDAFSPQKDPTLWTYDFLKLIKMKMTDNSILVSYSKSTPFRSALHELGFCVGKTFINDVDMGSVASLNSNFIKNSLSDFDIDLIKTKSGIFYRDENFNLDKVSIIKNREHEQLVSNRLSHTQFLKLYNS